MADGTGFGKWTTPTTTADGDMRAWVAPGALETVWFNTGSVCNIACTDCFMQSSPRNDSLAFIGFDEVDRFLREIVTEHSGVQEIGFTGGEPFMNPNFPAILEMTLRMGFRALVLTNGFGPVMGRKQQAVLNRLGTAYGDLLTLRVSLDHHTRRRHDAIRGAGNFDKAMAGLRHFCDSGFWVTVAGRRMTDETEGRARSRYRELFRRKGVQLEIADDRLVLFPSLEPDPEELPEITTGCWDKLGKTPESLMCSNARMVIRRRDAPQAEVVSCTLLPHDHRFTLGTTLTDSLRLVSLMNPMCATCVLFGVSCSG